MDWQRVTELDIAKYRNILASEPSIQTGRTLKRSTINHKLGVITQFYRFALKKGWIATPPFDLELIRIPGGAGAAFTPQRTACVATSLRLREAREELDIPLRLRTFGILSGASAPGATG